MERTRIIEAESILFMGINKWKKTPGTIIDAGVPVFAVEVSFMVVHNKLS